MKFPFYMLIALVLMLAACGEAPVEINHTVTANVAVPVSCVIKLPKEPVWMTPLVKAANHADKAQAIVHDLAAAHKYINELKAVLKACQ